MSETNNSNATKEKSEVEQAAVECPIGELDKSAKRPRENNQDKQGKEISDKSETTNDDNHEKRDKEAKKDHELPHKKVKTNDGSAAGTAAVECDKKKDKFVFGAASKFGTGFGIAKKDMKDGELANSVKSSSASDSKTEKSFAFGSGLSFGSGFKILKNKADNNSGDENKAPNDEEKVGDGSETLARASEEPNDNPKPLKLQKQEIRSGEESEECIYQVNAKLYQLSKIEEGWKERGVGVIKVNKSKEDKEKTRIVMRCRGILKVILNIQLVKGFTVQKGFTGSLQSEKFIRLLAVDDNGDPAQYAIKTGKKETTDELYNIIVKSVPK
ncbi:hypothetical protein SMKI_09G1060 [Saccharomyces mikatae IFO 1815]|uniref:RanBD1 domain-containing protein n=1 Tax=Saccharomyces mikatae IFO 1815 TaxID=226126 RepID=A0AA35J062_SACMI|nr:uncharacterized protein SMKI_09G1060 [Saccharomyces mikatae IFO 1815]CAI4039698.1 hypothetical protein SMKI_09G1060 [Saccharomyces mikatae IFO 1815]